MIAPTYSRLIYARSGVWADGEMEVYGGENVYNILYKYFEEVYYMLYYMSQSPNDIFLIKTDDVNVRNYRT